MKKLTILLAIISASLVSTQSFAQTKTPNNIVTALETSFSDVKDASWTIVGNYYKAEFAIDEQNISAYFNYEGELIATGRKINVSQLPISLQLDLKSTYKDFTVTQSVEVDVKDEPTYYLSIETPTKTLQLSSTSFGKWETYKAGNPLN